MNDLAPRRVREVDARVAFVATHRDAVVELLVEALDEVARSDSEAWQALRFDTVRKGVDWVLGAWSSAGFTPEATGYSWDAIDLELWVFADLRFWQILRLLELQARDAGPSPRPAGASRKEVTGHASLERAAAESVALAGDGAEAVMISAVQGFRDRLVRVLDDLGQRTHRAQEVLWLRSQERLRKAITSIIGEGWSRAADLPEWLSSRTAPTLAKECALAAFRYLILFEDLEPRDDGLPSRAFVLTYLANFEKPTWVPRPRDRWDVVPKRVVASQLVEIGIQAGSWEAVRAARAEMGRVVERGMKQVANLTWPLPEELEAAVQLGLRLLLAEDSITRTLRDEYARKAGRGSAGPSASAIESWHIDLAATRGKLGGGAV